MSSWIVPGRLFAVRRPKRGSGSEPEWCCCPLRIHNEIMCTSDAKSACPTGPCGSGGNAGIGVSSPSKTNRDRVGQPSFPPADIAEVKAAACETVRETKLPLSKQATVDLARPLPDQIGKSISRGTIFRILNTAAIKPCQHRSWIFPRTADLAEKAAVILDAYQGMWDGEPLGLNDYVLSADEKTSTQARIRFADAGNPICIYERNHLGSTEAHLIRASESVGCSQLVSEPTRHSSPASGGGAASPPSELSNWSRTSSSVGTVK